MTTCQSFEPHDRHAATCKECRAHWADHPMVARRALFASDDKHLIDAVISACKRDNQYPCERYWPKADWAGGPAPDCVCGRPRISHPSKQVLESVREWRKQHGLPVSRKPAEKICGNFNPTLTHPGVCQVCRHKWIDHPTSDRGLIIEKYPDAHRDWCKSILMNGDVNCSCMTWMEIQEALDKIGKGPVPQEAPVMCKQFVPQGPGNTRCKSCNEAFYMHPAAACGGHTDFMKWRADNMGNHELLMWFQTLPGKNRHDRLQSLKRLLSDPHFTHVPPSHMVNPSPFIMQAMIDALDTTSHLIQSPKDCEKAAEAVNMVEAAVIHESDLPLNHAAELHWCHACGNTTAEMRGAMCPDCIQILATEDWPDITRGRRSNDKGGS